VRVLCAPNAFKGSLAAASVAAAMAAGARDAHADAAELPVADGGDGTLDVLLGAAGGRGRTAVLTVTGPLGDPVLARFGWSGPGEAVVELAEASGLRLVAPDRRDALRATSLGTGELIAAALDAGARRIVVGAGGSASTDGGAGIAAALGVRLRGGGHPLSPGGSALTELESIDAAGLHPRLRSCAVVVAADVDAPLLGPRGAAAVFAPQKGASPPEVALLERALARLAAVLERDLHVPLAVATLPGAGAGGGSGYGLAAIAEARLVSGAALVCDLAGIDAALRQADLVVTGEGRLDPSTAAGKAPAEVARRARAAGLACVALTGSAIDPPPLFDEVVEIGSGLPPGESMARAAELLRTATAALVRRRGAAQ